MFHKVPYCFNIFINDLITLITNNCDAYNYHDYADDNSVCCYANWISDVKLNLEYVSKLIGEWFDENNLKAHPAKFQAIILYQSDSHVNEHINIESQIVQISNVVKLLSVYIDCNLDFNFHVSDLCKKAGRKINALSRVTTHLDEQGTFIVVISSHCNYCTLV